MTKYVTTCGKLYLAGEYAVLTPGQSALIKNINIRMQAEIDFSETYQLVSDMFNYTVDLNPDQNYALIQETILVMEEFLADQGLKLRPIRLSISGKMERDGKKFGIGSSGSVVLLTIKAMAELYDLSLSRDSLFRLATYVLVKRGDNGSMGDLACIAFEDLILYQSFDRHSLAQLIQEIPLRQVLASDWGYQIKPVSSQLTCQFLVGWTQEPSISAEMITQVKSAITPQFLSETEKATQKLTKAIERGNQQGSIQQINRISELLANLSPLIYTEDLVALRQATEGLEAVAKSSGSGGGDCGIALVFSKVAEKKIKERWQRLGIELLYASEL